MKDIPKYELTEHELVDIETKEKTQNVLLNEAERITLNYALALNGSNLRYLPLLKEKDAIR